MIRKQYTPKKKEGEPKQNALSNMYDKLMAYAKVIEGSDWKMGWASTQHTWMGLPQNISGRPYTGGNSFYLMMATMANNHNVPIYATFNQIQKMNEKLMDEKGRIPKEKWNEAVHVLKGEQSEVVVFNTPIYVNPDKPKQKPLSTKEYDNLPKEEKEKYNQIWTHMPHVIFNIDQTNMREVRPELYEKLVERMMPKQKQTFRQDTMGMYEEPAIDYILNNQTWRCPIAFDKESKDAFYRPSDDKIFVPMKEQYNIPYTGKELQRDIDQYITPAINMKPAITDFSDADRQMLNVEANKHDKEYLAELRATIMLENTFGHQLGVLRQDGQAIGDYANQVLQEITKDRAKVIATKDTEAKIIGGQDYYTTFLHEGAHSMHKELNIELNATGDKRGYAREEMRVESSTAMVASALGYSTNMFINSAAYVRGWNETANIQEKTKQMQQLISDINKTVNRMGEIIDDARQKVGQEPVFKRSTTDDQKAEQQPKGKEILSPIANDQKPVPTPEQSPALETQAAQSQQQPKDKEIPSPTADDQKAEQTVKPQDPKVTTNPIDATNPMASNTPTATDQKAVQTSEQKPALEDQTQKPQGEAITTPTATDQKAEQTQHSQTTQAAQPIDAINTMASIPPFATPQSKQHPKGEAIPSPIANDQKPVQTPEQNPALETQAAQSQQQPKGKEIPSPTADEQKAVQPQHSQTTQQHPKDKEISSPNATEANVPTQEVAAKAPYADEPTQESKKTSYNIPDEYPQDRVAEVPILHNTEFSLWNKLSALLMDTSEEKHMKTAPNEILVLETDEDQGLSDMEKMHLTEVWQHPSEGIISFTIEGSNEVLDLSDFPEFIPQVFDYVSQGAMDMTEEKGRPEELEMPKPKDLVFTYDMATQTPKDRPSDIVFVKDTDPVSHTPTYTAYGRDADRLAEKVSSSIAAMRTEINGRRYPNATVNEGNLDAVRADLMTKNVQPVIIDTKGVRITDDNKLDYTKEERKAFLNSLKPETQQLKNINETLQRMGNPDSILLPQNYGRPSGSRELFIPHRFGYQEINFAEIKRFKDGSYRAGNKDEGYYPIAKMDTNNLSTVEQALHHAWLNMPQNLVKELVLQVQSGKAEVEHDNAKGRYVVTINDPEGRFGPYERGFKKFTVGADLPNEVLLHKDWNNWTSAIKVDPDTVRQIVSYAESKIDSKLSKNRNALSHAHTIDDFTLRNVSGDWRLSANIDGKRMPEVSIDHKDVIELKHGRMSQEEITLKSYHEMLSDKQQQSHVRGRGMH